MILSNVEIFRALDDGRLVISPEPQPRMPTIGSNHCPYDTHSVDLRLADEISIPQEGQITYDLTKPGKIANTLARHCKKLTLTALQPLRLKPAQFVLGITKESVALPFNEGDPTCLAARIVRGHYPVNGVVGMG
jgi:deoxycytidine triphosphate deaminase